MIWCSLLPYPPEIWRKDKVDGVKLKIRMQQWLHATCAILHRSWLGNVAVIKKRQIVTASNFINKRSWIILVLGFIRQLEIKPHCEQRVEIISVAPPYCQTACQWSAVSLNALAYLNSSFQPNVQFRITTLGFFSSVSVLIVLIELSNRIGNSRNFCCWLWKSL